MKPTGNTSLITGGTSGIRLALAVTLQAAGNKLIIAGRRQALLDQASHAHPGMTGYALDMADVAGIAGFAAKLVKDHPDLNVLINNAGIMQAEDLVKADFDIAEITVTSNLPGPFRLTAALLPHLMARASATLINVTLGLVFVPLVATPTHKPPKQPSIPTANPCAISFATPRLRCRNSPHPPWMPLSPKRWAL